MGCDPHARYQPIMPHKDEPDGEGLSEVSFTEPSEDEEGDTDDVLSNVSNGLRSLRIKEPAAKRRIGIKISSASVRRFSSSGRLQVHLVPEREDGPTYMIGDSSERAPAPRGWSRVLPSRP